MTPGEDLFPIDDGDTPLTPGEQPGERDLGGRRLQSRGD